MSRIPEELIFYYDTVHGLTRGPRGADRNAGRGGRTAGRTVRHAGRTLGRAPGWREQTPSRSTVQVPVNRGGSSTSRRHPRELEPERPQKHQSVEVNSTEVAANDVQIATATPAREATPEIPRSSLPHVNRMGTALGSSSSTRQRIYEILNVPSFLSDLGPGIYSRVREWIETKDVPLCASVKAALFHPRTTPGQQLRPALDVREDESVFTDIPANGDTLGYHLLKGLQLPIDRPADNVVAPVAQLAHDLAVVSISLPLSLFFFNLFFRLIL